MTQRAGLSKYLGAIQRYSVLEQAEVAELFGRFRAGDAAAGQRLVEANLRFVAFVAREFHSYGEELDDLISEGNLGLYTALRRYDPSRGVPFATFAFWWIRRQIQRYIAANVSVVRPPCRPTERRLFGRAEAAGDGEQAPRCAAVADVSLDELSSDGAPLLERLASGTGDPEQLLIQQEQERVLSSVLQEGISSLSGKERQVIERRFAAPVKPFLREIAEEMGMSREGVRKVEQKALRELQSRLKRSDCCAAPEWNPEPLHALEAA